MGIPRLPLFLCTIAYFAACQPATKAGSDEQLPLAADAITAFQSAQQFLLEGAFDAAESKAEVGAAYGGRASYPHRQFLHGMIAYTRGENARALAGQVEAGLPEWDLAIRQFERALKEFAQAALGLRDDHDAARRNAERAWIALEECRTGRAKAAAQKKQAATEPKEEPSASDEPVAPKSEALGTEDDPDATITEELLLQQVLSEVWEKLKEKEQQKREVRRQFQARLAQPGARDW